MRQLNVQSVMNDSVQTGHGSAVSLHALTLGYAVPQGDFRAIVHSVFHAAVNLRPASGDLLLTLTGAGEADLPQGIRVDTPEDFSFETLRVGAKAACQSGRLEFEDASLHIDLLTGRRWKCDLPAAGRAIDRSAFAGGWKLVWEALNERQVREGAEIVAAKLFRPDEAAQTATSRKMGAGLRTLVESARRCELMDESALERLVGLGPGLTPAGDDLLVGLLAGLRCAAGKDKARGVFLHRLGETVIHLSGRTNDISRTYLVHAAHGQVSGSLEALARSVCQGEAPVHLLASASTAMRAGHSSGMDAVTGLLAGLGVWTLEGELAAFATAWDFPRD